MNSNTNSNLKILVVDDDAAMAETLADIFAIEGYTAETALSGEDALAKLAQTPFDCMIADIKLTGMNGVAMYELVRTSHPHMPVLLMTAYASEPLVRTGRRLGIVAVLNKPLNIARILSFLKYLHAQHGCPKAPLDRTRIEEMRRLLYQAGDDDSIT